MSLETEQLIKEIKSRFDHATQKTLLKEKYHSKLTFAYCGGMWKAGPELVSVLTACPDETAVIEDLYGIPVKINVPDMLMLTQQRWQEQMSSWLVEYEQLSQQR